MIPALLGVGWGVLVAAPLVARARRRAPGARATGLAPAVEASGTRRSFLVGLAARLPRPPSPVTKVASDLARRIRVRRVESVVERDLPVTVDLLGVAVASGCTPFLAVEVAAQWSPPLVAAALDRVLRACTLGRSFADALADAVAELPRLGPVADALLVSDRLGAPVADALMRVAADLRADLRRRAESHARTVPVRLLFPLVFLVLPAFGLLTIVPAIAAGLAG